MVKNKKGSKKKGKGRGSLEALEPAYTDVGDQQHNAGLDALVGEASDQRSERSARSRESREKAVTEVDYPSEIIDESARSRPSRENLAHKKVAGGSHDARDMWEPAASSSLPSLTPSPTVDRRPDTNSNRFAELFKPPLLTRPISAENHNLHEEGTHSASGLLSSSPYPVSEKSMDEQARRERRAEKQRRSRAESIESAELHEAAVRSLKDLQARGPDDEEPRAFSWNDDANMRAAREALAREWGENESSEVFRRRKEALARTERQLRNMRVDEDRQYAEEINNFQWLAKNARKIDCIKPIWLKYGESWRRNAKRPPR
ncbi:hypothetical protein B0H11DRAFT_1900382 [Mycena galericulata]|nr:hypothetical protein B0H11DRAFT_1900382 [Mycena galericulata]